MKTVGVMRPDGLAMALPQFKVVEMMPHPARCGCLETPAPYFDSNSEEHGYQVLIRVRAFSCNYRDRALIWQSLVHSQHNSLNPFGSEFCGEVVKIGRDVTNVTTGDRVLGVFAYPTPVEPRSKPGVPTNTSSQEFLIISALKVMRVPEAMSDAEAAAFGLNAVTVTSMFRRIGLHREDRLLICSGRSNVSLFSCIAASAHGARCDVLTSTPGIENTLTELGAECVFLLDKPEEGLTGCRPIVERAAELKGYTAVVDPFFDVHLLQVPTLLAIGARYVSCGMARQVSSDTLAVKGDFARMFSEGFAQMSMKNVVVTLNCLGTLEDQKLALEEWAAGRMKVVLDREFYLGQEAEFLTRTYLDPQRLGKVVYHFDRN